MVVDRTLRCVDSTFLIGKIKRQFASASTVDSFLIQKLMKIGFGFSVTSERLLDQLGA